MGYGWGVETLVLRSAIWTKQHYVGLLHRGGRQMGWIAIMGVAKDVDWGRITVERKQNPIAWKSAVLPLVSADGRSQVSDTTISLVLCN